MADNEKLYDFSTNSNTYVPEPAPPAQPPVQQAPAQPPHSVPVQGYPAPATPGGPGGPGGYAPAYYQSPHMMMPRSHVVLEESKFRLRMLALGWSMFAMLNLLSWAFFAAILCLVAAGVAFSTTMEPLDLKQTVFRAKLFTGLLVVYTIIFVGSSLWASANASYFAETRCPPEDVTDCTDYYQKSFLLDALITTVCCAVCINTSYSHIGKAKKAAADAPAGPPNGGGPGGYQVYLVPGTYGGAPGGPAPPTGGSLYPSTGSMVQPQAPPPPPQ